MNPIEFYFSEYKQDVFLDQDVFQKKQNGVYVEVGAGDGILYSNTLFFERYRGWKGLCIEPRSLEFNKLVRNRKKSICENACISLLGGYENFVEFTGNWLPMLSGLERNFYKEHQEVVERGMNQPENNHKKKVTQIRTYRLQELLDKHNITNVDYCSIDTEGSDFEVLRSIDFSKTKVDVFSVENNYEDKTIEQFMVENGYELIREIGIKKVALDQIYKKK